MGNVLRTWIRDPVHGAVRLTEVERRVIDCRCFQRLRRIKQLGLACLAFPSADYPRFEHSLGVLQVMGRMLDVLQRDLSAGNKLSEQEIQEYRLAALLHDVGHYPFSHAMEYALDEAFKKSVVQPAIQNTEKSMSIPGVAPLNHERVGKLIVTRDDQLSEVLSKAGLDPVRVARIFNREGPLKFANLISSDLDADRLDYLARTAKHTGLPYGATDIDYLVEHLCVDDSDPPRVCLDGKALRPAEHMLLARYFDYQTLVYQRTVAGMELLLKEALVDWVREVQSDCSEVGILTKLENGDWNAFDDVGVMNALREYSKQLKDPVKKALLRCVLERKPPKAVAEAEWLGDNSKKAVEDFGNHVKFAEKMIDKWAREFGIPKEYWRTWRVERASLTKSSPSMPTAEALGAGERDFDKYEQAIRIRKSSGKTSDAIWDMPRSLMRILANHALYAFRFYVIPPEGVEVDRHKIRSKIESDLPTIQWK